MRSHEVKEPYNHFSIVERQFSELGAQRAPPSVCLGLKGPYVLLGTSRDGHLGEGPDPTPLPQYHPEGVRTPT